MGNFGKQFLRFVVCLVVLTYIFTIKACCPLGRYPNGQHIEKLITLG